MATSLNDELAALFSLMADVMDIKGENMFKVLAFRKVGRILEALGPDARALIEQDKLKDVEGIGEHSRRVIEEYVRTGQCTEAEQLVTSIPAGLLPLLKLEGMGPKTVALLWKQRNITSAEDLAKALAEGKLEGIKGIGEKKIEAMKHALEVQAKSAGRVGIGEALPVARLLLQQVSELPGVVRAEIAGSLRRWRETIGDVDILVAVKDAAGGEKITAAFARLPGVDRALTVGAVKASVISESGLQVDLRILPVEHFGAGLMYFTGSKDHNVRIRTLAQKKGMTLNEWGLYQLAEYEKAEKKIGEAPAVKALAAETEEAIYRELGLEFIPAELREDRGEVEAAFAEGRRSKPGATDVEVTESDITQYIALQLEFQAFPVDWEDSEAPVWLHDIRKLLRGRESADCTPVENLLAFAEDRLMVEFPEAANPPARRHVPRWNFELPKEPVGVIVEAWENAVPDALRIWWRELASVGLSQQPWGATSRRPGLYRFREQSSGKTVYVGMAGWRGGKGVEDRLHFHRTKTRKVSSLRKHIGQWLTEQRAKGQAAIVVAGKLPVLIERTDIRGDLHSHTTASDGINTLEEMAQAALARGYQYLGITDHSKSQAVANGLPAARLLNQIEQIRKLNDKLKGITLLAGSEVDILADGHLDYEDEVLAELDFVIASPHFSLKQAEEKATDRLLRAIENKYVNVIGHPTGRLIGGREGLPLDFVRLFKAAADTGTALEINAGYPRLDLNEVHSRAAVEAGCKLSINTDAHRAESLGEIQYGLGVARRAWVTAKSVINCMPLADLKNFVARKR